MIVEVIPPALMPRVPGFQFVGSRDYEAEADGELSNIDEAYCIFDFRRTTT
jgi:hypothetical protein